jgi:hypothetical protein
MASGTNRHAGYTQLRPEPERADQRHEPLPIGFCVVVTIASLSLRVDSITLYLRFMDSCQLWCHTPLTLPVFPVYPLYFGLRSGPVSGLTGMGPVINVILTDALTR